MEEVTGRLESWSYVDLGPDEYWLVGLLYDDVKGRFYQGQYIHTSPILSKHFPKNRLRKGEVVSTTYSKYLLGESFANQVITALKD